EMSDELEERLERALREQAPANADTQERARRAALAAMPPPGGRHRLRGRGPATVIAACAAAFVFGGVTLAANGGRIPLVGGTSHERAKPRTSPRRAHPG